MVAFKPKQKHVERGPSKAAVQEAFFAWPQADLTLGLASLDRDHGQMASLINQIHAALVQNRDRVAAARIMEEVLREIRTHFLREEEAMAQAGYPDLDPHGAEHAQLLKEAGELTRQLYSGSLSALSFPTFLKNWFVAHTQGPDRAYAGWSRYRPPVQSPGYVPAPAPSAPAGPPLPAAPASQPVAAASPQAPVPRLLMAPLPPPTPLAAAPVRPRPFQVPPPALPAPAAPRPQPKAPAPHLVPLQLKPLPAVPGPARVQPPQLPAPLSPIGVLRPKLRTNSPEPAQPSQARPSGGDVPEAPAEEAGSAAGRSPSR